MTTVLRTERRVPLARQMTARFARMTKLPLCRQRRHIIAPKVLVIAAKPLVIAPEVHRHCRFRRLVIAGPTVATTEASRPSGR
jgi:hypothetical protein